MNDLFGHDSSRFLRQKLIRSRCVHPTGAFVEFNKDEVERSVPERFEQQVQKYPARLAVKTANHQVTYDELNRTANQVAMAILNQRGEGEEPIALLMEKDILMIGAIFGVLKAGKAYVPLDPTYPYARLKYMVEDLQLELMVTNSRNFLLASELTQGGCRVINMEEFDPGLPVDDPRLSISPDTLAWILYTSGSTGQPKGIMQNHRNTLQHARDIINGFHICADDRVSLFASCSFGGSIADIFSALLNGATLFPFKLRQEGFGDMASWLIQNEITTCTFVPTVYRHFVSTLTGAEDLPSLRLIRLAGESLFKRDVELYKKHFSPDCILLNGYGSTEAIVFREYLIDKETQITENNVQVGYATEDTETMLLDENGHQVGFNQVGEIAVRSQYISSGYWGKPDLTRSKFFSDAKDEKQRIYITGDMGLMLPDGCLQYLGRKDFQVKIRGHRVEVAEIETALLDLDTVKEAAVSAQEDRYGEMRLIAYLVPDEQSSPTVSALICALVEVLPDYMIPSAFVMLDQMPLTTTGKVDRRMLPAPGTGRPELETPFVAPRTPVEETLAEIWSEILNLDQAGINDSFLELGGHSLSATRVISRVINTFSIKISLESLFQSPTIADMALLITQNQAVEMDDEYIGQLLTMLGERQIEDV